MPKGNLTPYRLGLVSQSEQSEVNGPEDNLISLEELVTRAKRRGLNFGKGSPYHRLRYYTKIGLIPHAKRHSFNGKPPSASYPEILVDTLIQIDTEIKAGKSIQAILREQRTENTRLPTSDATPDFASRSRSGRAVGYGGQGEQQKSEQEAKEAVGLPAVMITPIPQINPPPPAPHVSTPIPPAEKGPSQPETMDHGPWTTDHEPLNTDRELSPVDDGPSTVSPFWIQSAKARPYIAVAALTFLVVTIFAPLFYFRHSVVRSLNPWAGKEQVAKLALPSNAGQILGTLSNPYLTINVETDLNKLVRAKGGIKTEGADVDASTGKVYASNILYGISAGTNVAVSGDAQKPIISVPNLGVGDITAVLAGSGLSGGGTSGSVTLGLTNSSLTVAAGAGLTGGGAVSLGGTTTLSADLESGSGLSTATGKLSLLRSCSTSGELLKWIGGSWVCAGDAGGSVGVIEVQEDNDPLKLWNDVSRIIFDGTDFELTHATPNATVAVDYTNFGNRATTLNIGVDATASHTVNIATNNTFADTINIGNSNADVAITGDAWSVTNAGAAAFYTSVTTPTILTAAGDLTLNPATTLVSVAGGGIKDVNALWGYDAGVSGSLDIYGVAGPVATRGNIIKFFTDDNAVGQVERLRIGRGGAQGFAPISSYESLVFQNDGLLLDLSAINNAGGNEGLRLPQNASTSLGVPTSGVGYLAYATDTKALYYWDGSAWVWVASGSGGSKWTAVADPPTDFTYLTATGNDLVLGSSTIAAATFYMDVSAGELTLGNNQTPTSGSLKLYETATTPTQYGTLKVADLTSSTTYTLPILSGSTSVDVCVKSGSSSNCFGAGGGGIGGTGTQNYITKWADNGNNIGNSQIFDDGTNVGLGTDIPSAIFDVYGKLGTTTTSSDINSRGASGTGNITVASTTGFPASGTVVVDSEAMFFTVVDATTINITTRGRLGTTGTAHANGSTLSFLETLVSKGTTTTPHLTISSAGNVGIGTVTPATMLDVTYDTNQYTRSNGGQLEVKSTNATTPVFTVTGTSTADLVNIFDGTTEVFTILDGGNVGIGDNTPDYKLDVVGFGAENGIVIDNQTVGDGDPVLKFQVNEGADFTLTMGLDDSDSDKFKIGTTNLTTSTFLTLDTSTGNVGIGTATPGAFLDVDRVDTTSNTELIDLRVAGFTQTIGANLATARFTQFNQATFTGDIATRTVTDASTFYVAGAPTASTNAAITNAAALRIGAGSLANTTRGYGLYVEAPTGATNNYAAVFMGSGEGGNVGIGTATPGARLDIARPNSSRAGEAIDFRVASWTQTITAGYSDARFSQFNRPTITASSSQTVANAATVYIQNAPLASGSVSITNPYALWIDAGTSRFDGNVRVYDAGGTDYIDIAHDGTDVNLTYAGTTNLNIGAVGLVISDDQYIGLGASVGRLTFNANAGLDDTITTNTAHLQLGNVGAAAGELRFLEAGGTDYTGFKAPADVNAANPIYTLPAAFPGTDNFVLASSTSGILSWKLDAGGLSGSGSPSRLARWATSSTLDNGSINDLYNNVTMTIDSAGKVGISDSSPLALLTVGDGDLFQVDSSGNVTFNQTSPTITIGDNGTLSFKDNAGGGPYTLMTLFDQGTTGGIRVNGGIGAGIDPSTSIRLDVQASTSQDPTVRFGFTSMDPTKTGFQVGHGPTGTLSSFTGDVVNINSTRNLNGAATIDDSGNVLDISRSTIASAAGASHTVSGALVSISDSASQSSGGTVSNTANVLSLTQSCGSGITCSGAVLKVSNAGTGADIDIAHQLTTNQTGINISTFSTQTGTGIKFGGIPTSGILIDIPYMADIDAAPSSKGSIINAGGSVTGALSGFTGSYIKIAPTRSLSTDGSATDSGNFLNLIRTNSVSNGNTFTISGNMATFSNVFTATSGTIDVTGDILNLSSNCTGTCTYTGSTANILELNQQDSNASGSVLNILNSGSGSGINISGSTSLNAINIANAGTGTSVNIQQGITSGYGFRVSRPDTLTSGSLISLDTGGSTLTKGAGALTGNLLNIDYRAKTVFTKEDTGSMINVYRLNETTGSNTLTVSGDLVTFSSNCTQTSGTCTDTSNILELNQQYASASGAVLNILNSGTGPDIAFNTSPILRMADGGTMIWDDGTNELMRLVDNGTSNKGDLDVSGHGAFGTSASIDPDNVVQIAETLTTTTSNPNVSPSGAKIEFTINPSAEPSGDPGNIYGRAVDARITATGLNLTNKVNATAIRGEAVFNGTAASDTLGNLFALRGYVKIAGTSAAATVDNAYGLDIMTADLALGGLGSITNLYGLHVASQAIGTNSNYGARIDSATTQTLLICGESNCTTAAGGIAFGSTESTRANLYRSADNTLKTDDQFNITTSASANWVNAQTINFTVTNPGVLTNNALEIVVTTNQSSPTVNGLAIYHGIISSSVLDNFIFLSGALGDSCCKTVANGILFEDTSSLIITDAIDASDSLIVNAINIGANNIDGTNFDVIGGLAASGNQDQVVLGSGGTIPTLAAGQTFRGLYLNYVNSTSHTGGTVYGIDIQGITQDSDAAETAINIGAGWDSALVINDTTPTEFIDIDWSGTTTNAWDIIASAVTTGDVLHLLSSSTAATSSDLVDASHQATYNTSRTIDGNLLDLDRTLTASGGSTTLTVDAPLAVFTDTCSVASGGTCSYTANANVLSLVQSVSSASGAVLNILNSGTGEGIKLAASVAPTNDMMVITNTGQAASANGVDGLYINLVGADNGSATATLSALHLDVDPPSPGAGSDDTFIGLKIDDSDASGAKENAIQIGDNWDNSILGVGTLSLASTLTATPTGGAISIGTSDATPIILTGAYTGLNIDLQSNYTPGANNRTGINIAALTTGTGTAETAINIGSGWDDGIKISTGNVTSASRDGVDITTGTITSSGTLNALTTTLTGTSAGTVNGLYIFPTGSWGGATVSGLNIDQFSASAGTVTAINVGTMTDGGATTTAINIGIGWDNIISGTTAGSNLFSFTNFSVTSAGVVTAAGTGTHDFEGTLRIDAPSGAKTERLCQSGGGSGDGVSLNEAVIGDCSASGQADFAEYYGSDGTLAAGDLVIIDPTKGAVLVETSVGIGSKSWVVRSSNSYDGDLIGVVSTNPYTEILSAGVFSPEENPTPIALSGRVPVKVSTENGAIEPGDPLTSSSTPGVAMKAIASGPIIGKALEGTDGNTPEVCRRRNPTSGVEEEVPCGKIMVFVSVGWYVAPITGSSQPQAASFSSIDTETLTAGTVNTQVLFVGNVKFSMNTDGSLEIDGDVKLSGDLTAKNLIVLEEVKAPKTTTEKLNIATPAASPDGKNNASIGTDKIVAEQTSVTIETTAVTGNSKIFVTPTTKTDKVLSVTTKVEGTSFIVETNEPAPTQDIEFNWWIVN